MGHSKDSALSGKPAKPSKPEKPYPEFPLFPHASGRWAKKIRQKLHYFGSWADGPAAARARFDREWPYLARGETPPPIDDVDTQNDTQDTRADRAAANGKAKKPEKPYPEFPLFPHSTGRWAKKIRQRLHYFGSWADGPQAALAEFQRQWPYLSVGKTPPAPDDGDACTIADLCNSFLQSKENKLNAGELSPRTFRDYYDSCARLVEQFGKVRRVDDLRPDDFEAFRKRLADRHGTVSLKNEINRCRVVFKFALEQRLIDQPVIYGQSFNRPSAKAIRKARNAAGLRMFEADELRRIIDAADVHLRAMILLAVNCGFGNTDLANLPQSAVDLGRGWIDYPRPKTEIHRRVPLWPETIEALSRAIASRPTPNDAADVDLVFLTRQRQRWVRIRTVERDDGTIKQVAIDALTQKFAKLIQKLGIKGNRGFYALRHTFETIGGESKDQVAVNAVMGHVDTTMAGQYRQRISDERLQAVVNVVRAWLFGLEVDHV